MKKSMMTILYILTACLLLLAGIWIYFQKMLEQVERSDAGKNTVYKKHYALIAEDGDSLLWQSVYESARQAAEESDAYLELIQADDNSDYSQTDRIQIAIASQVDGIILEPDGSQEVRDLIDAASDAGIPVITILEDDSESKRLSFVGLNSYQMADAYAEEALKLLAGDTTEILVLLRAEASDTGLVYAQMVTAIEQRKPSEKSVNISSYGVDSSVDFDTEEVIRDIFVNSESLPDVLICMDEVITECAYQALVDYNEVGNVNIIGFYYSGAILEAVQKGTIPATIALDMEEIGAYSVSALEEYQSLGHASNYYSVGLNVITADNAGVFLETEASQEDGG